MDFKNWSAEQIANEVRANRISRDQISEIFSEKIERLNPLYSCFLDFGKKCFNPEKLGELAGVPISIKDLIDTDFLVTTYGTSAFKEHQPARNAAIVDSLLEAGAIIVGKTNLTECGSSDYHPDFPVPVNPSNNNLWTGISSSGAAVSVSAGMCQVAIASDTGGSVRTPAACHGLVGFKPTKGTLDTRGMLSFSPSLDHLGIIAANVSDIITTYRAITKKDISTKPRKPEFVVGCDLDSLSRNVSPSVFNQIQENIERLKKQGFSIKKITFPEVGSLAKGWLDYASYELLNFSSHDWLKHESTIGNGLRLTLRYGKEITSDRYKEVSKEADVFRERLNRVFEEVDYIFSPLLPFDLPSKDFQFDFYKLDHQFQFLVPYNFSGNPTINIPNSYSSSVLYSNLQITAPVGHDNLLLDFARSVETSLGVAR